MRKGKRKDLYEQFFGKNPRNNPFRVLANQSKWFENPADMRYIYGGSFCHLAPAFFFGPGIFVDTDKRAAAFFANCQDLVEKHISAARVGGDGAPHPHPRFLHQPYDDPLPGVDDGWADLVISSYSGVASAPLKRYLRDGGYLFCNDSHGDASSAHDDAEFTLVGGVSLSGEWIDSLSPFAKSTEYFLFQFRPAGSPARKKRRSKE